MKPVYLRIAFVVVLAALVIGLCWLALHKAYGRGEAATQQLWDRAVAQAAEEALERDRKATVDSEGVADASRDEAHQQADRTTTQTGESAARIEYVYLQHPAPACPAEPVPDGVLRELDEAVRATAAAKGRLPADVGR